MLELADRHDLGSCAERRVGSSPSFPTILSHEELNLKIEQTPRDDQQVQITVELEDSIHEQFKQRAAKKIARESKVPGFRPGKAPFNVILRIYGNDLLEKQATELIIDDVYPKAIDEAKIKPSGPGMLEKIVSVHPPKFSFIIPLEPEIKLGDYRSIRQNYALPKVEQKRIDEYLHRMQTSYATAEPVERPAEKGDLVYLKITGTLDKANEGEDPVIYKEVPSQVLVGDESFQENNFPFQGFAAQVTGMSVNEQKDISNTFPENFENEKIQGKKVNFKISVQSIKAMKLPELNDEFAKTVGSFETLDALRTTIRNQIEYSTRQEYDRKYFDEVLGKILAQAQFKYPPQMLEHEAEHVIESIEKDLAAQKLDLPAYLKTLQKEKEKFIEEDVKPIAKKRLEQSLLLEELARIEEIKLEKEDLNQAFSQTVQELQMTTDFQKLQRKMAPEKLSNAIALQAANRLLNDRVLDCIKAIANGEIEKKAREEKEAKAQAKTAAAEPKKASTNKSAKQVTEAASIDPAPKASE